MGVDIIRLDGYLGDRQGHCSDKKSLCIAKLSSTPVRCCRLTYLQLWLYHQYVRLSQFLSTEIFLAWARNALLNSPSIIFGAGSNSAAFVTSQQDETFGPYRFMMVFLPTRWLYCSIDFGKIPLESKTVLIDDIMIGNCFASEEELPH